MGLVQSASQVEVRRSRMPQPWRAGLPWAAAALVSLGAGLFVIYSRELVAVAAGCLLVGAVRALLEFRDLWVLRRAADAVLRTGARVHPYSKLLVWRAGELTSARNRKILSRSFRNIVRELEQPSFMSPVPLNRRDAREHADLLVALAERLGNPDSSIRPHGVVLIEDLLTDGANSPLFGAGHGPLDGRESARPDLGLVLEGCLAALRPTGVEPGSSSTSGPSTNPKVFDPSEATNGRVSAHGGGNH